MNNIIYDTKNEIFLENGKEIVLTAKEYYILKHFFENPKKLLNRDSLKKIIYNNQEKDLKSNIIERHIRAIRSKFQSNPIRTIRGLGYRLITDEE
jgi:DNA-binding response OmpR family regulator